ncbi:carbohydrate ABC transporter permease [Ruania halotolerans]|uniref:carbohydrate ABC transporter permease n=1 Tax=Ruania halotolerans TaxID=2897773 RepID=UPI001E39D518|nr:sugar ABC transporter permease [Ruania halotolerans]UFU06998.1 sugar ABC transporter permease [Ruania halotolerans]
MTTTKNARPQWDLSGSTFRDSQRSARRISDLRFAWLLILPGVAMLLAVVLYPLVRSLSSAFFSESLLYPGREFVGLANIQAALGDDFVRLLWQTGIFTVGATVLPFIVGLGVALALNARLPGRSILRGAFLFPWLLPAVVVSFLWMWIFDASYGALNGLLEQLSLIDGPRAWLFDTTTARGALIVAKSWNAFPWIMVMLLAALQTVPEDLHEAASLDGAGKIRRFWTVTWPHISGVAGIVVLLEFIWNFQHFDLIFVMTGGGPAQTTQTLATALYDSAFRSYDLGQAGAIGILWMIVLLVLVVFYVRFSERKEAN